MRHERRRPAVPVTVDEAFAFVREHGVVLASAKGPVPRLASAIAGESIEGSWWAHRESHRIFAILQAVGESKDVLVCRLVAGKVTFVHRRLWPAVVRAATRFPPQWIAQVREEHSPSGKHVLHEIPFPEWVPGDVNAQAAELGEREALNALGPWASAANRPPKPTRSKRRAT